MIANMETLLLYLELCNIPLVGLPPFPTQGMIEALVILLSPPLPGLLFSIPHNRIS
jgi:hypothetical protein